MIAARGKTEMPICRGQDARFTVVWYSSTAVHWLFK